ncbi:hypothetical protein ABID44_001584 [Aquamicrobium ahrensii]|uniref:Uncharacterized protein n=1 Tax=Aquamicrobium ahrensii TaxID=469551 RepID=A0ABV2KMG0_9HYPH
MGRAKARAEVAALFRFADAPLTSTISTVSAGRRKPAPEISCRILPHASSGCYSGPERRSRRCARPL